MVSEVSLPLQGISPIMAQHSFQAASPRGRPGMKGSPPMKFHSMTPLWCLLPHEDSSCKAQHCELEGRVRNLHGNLLESGGRGGEESRLSLSGRCIFLTVCEVVLESAHPDHSESLIH